MLLITGDTHGEFSRFSTKRTKGLFSEGDYIIIAGDFGLVWSDDDWFEYNKNIFENRPYTTLFVDGNHENFDMLNSYDVEEWHGGKVHHIVRDKVIHLMRGQVYTIDNTKIFTFGGAQSHDIDGGVLDRKDPLFRQKVKSANVRMLPYRIIGESWWKEEMPSDEEYKEGLDNLEKNNWQVDYIVTHDICESIIPDIQRFICNHKIESDKLNKYLEEINSKTTFKKWFNGHLHIDSVLDDKHVALYRSIRELR